MFDDAFFDALFFDAVTVETSAIPVGGRGDVFYAPRIIPIEDDDDILLAWFMFMRQPYDNQ